MIKKKMKVNPKRQNAANEDITNVKIMARAPYGRQFATILRISFLQRLRSPTILLEAIMPSVFLVFLCIFASKVKTYSADSRDPPLDEYIPFALIGGPAPNFGMIPRTADTEKFIDILNVISPFPFKENVTYFQDLAQYKEFIYQNREVSDRFYATELSNIYKKNSIAKLFHESDNSQNAFSQSTDSKDLNINQQNQNQQTKNPQKMNQHNKNDQENQNNNINLNKQTKYINNKQNVNLNSSFQSSEAALSSTISPSESVPINSVKISSNGMTLGSLPYLLQNIASALLNVTVLKNTPISIKYQQFPHKKLFKMDTDNALYLAIFSTVQPISGLLTTGVYYGTEAESGLRDLLTFYGLSCFVNEIRWFILCFVMVFVTSIPYAIALACIIKTNFGLLIVYYILRTSALSSFLLFLCSLWPVAKMGNIAGYGILISLFVLIFLAFFTWLFTDESMETKYILSVIFPHACAAYTMAQIGSGAVKNFNQLSETVYFPVKNGLIIMAADTVLFYLLFIILERIKTRLWFPAPIKWRNSLNFTADFNEPPIIITNLSKIYGKNNSSNKTSTSTNKSDSNKTVALDDISFAVNLGETLAIVGPNGAGKSTLMNILSGTKIPTEGKVCFQGVDAIQNITTMHQLVGLCPQDNLFMNDLTAYEWVHAICELRNEPDFDFSEIMQSLGLDEICKSTRINKMSGGNKRKTCLAAALVCNPPIVILDEATSGVDFTSRTRIWSIISSLKKTTVIMATHTLEECEKIADRIMVVADGKIAECETPNNLRQIYKCGYLIETNIENQSKLEGVLNEVEKDFVINNSHNHKNDNNDDQQNEQNEQNAENESADLASIKKKFETQIEDQKVKLYVSADEEKVLSKLLEKIDFSYILQIQSLEEQIFKDIQNHELVKNIEVSDSFESSYIDDHPPV